VSTEPTRVLFVTSNGAGMGHLTRQLAVALAGAGSLDPTLFSLSMALPVVTGHGVPGEYCPSVERRWMPQRLWHGYLRERLVAIVEEIGAKAVTFDGVAPYPGILAARDELRDVAFVWMRRGMWREDVNTAQLRKSAYFDRILEPGDLAMAADVGPTASRDDAIRIPPVTMLDVVPLLPRQEAAASLGIDPNRPTVLVTLGSGRLGEVERPGAVVVDALLDDPAWQVCVTRPDIAEKAVPLRNRDRVIELTGVYPLVRYLGAFDAAVSAAGYNAVHELVPAAVPTLLVPNPATRTDDQVRRATHLAERGLTLTAHPGARDDLALATRRLSDPSLRDALAAACADVPEKQRSGGAAAAATEVARLATGFTERRRTIRQQLARLDMRGRETAKRLLGPAGTDFVRRTLGRTYEDLNQRLCVHLEAEGPVPDTEPLAFGSDIPPERIRSGGPVEHLLSGTSDAYAARRREIVDEYYDVR
jgi:hypothetical protein